VGRFELPNVERIGAYAYLRHRWRDESGKRHSQRIALGRADAPDFAERLAAAQRPAEGRKAHAPGSIAALITLFRPVLVKRQLADSTRQNYGIYLDRIAADHGHRSVKGMRPVHLYTIRDNLADTPGVARNYLSVFRLLMAFACERDWRPNNPVAGIPALPIGEHEPWPAELLQRAIDTARPRLRLAIITALTTGQRIGDCIRLQHAWIKGGICELQQEKTAVAAAFPVHPLLTAEIEAQPRRALTILYDRTGQPYATEEPLQSQLRRLMSDLGETGYSFHGLRKNACCYLLELGLSDATVGSLLGMSAATVRHYGKRTRALMLARKAAETVTSAQVLPMVQAKPGAK
jgi:integrase